ncbi:hypothetical protein F2Q70_00011658 [Brassica cretica]|uniref:Uncharacterized protein n=1 Tax=Brassica cretica TaxID=69181 RepID=A0A8S9M142_BRACR|nr:hypothetical protein F2Q70_00011658 [Brassica cretica]
MSQKKISLKLVKSMETLMEEKYVLNPVKKKIKKSLMLKRDHGHEQGPEAYLRWEQDMEDWFQHHNIQEENKPIIAEDTLTKNAFWHWDHEANYWLDDHPSGASWAEMKEILREEYVVVAEINGKDYFKSTIHPEPRRLILATRPNRKVKLKKAHDLESNPESKLIIKGKTELTSPESPKRYDTFKSFSKEPMKQKKVVLKKDVKAPPKEPSLLEHLSGEDGPTTSSILLQEEPADQSPNKQAVPLDAPIKLPNQVSATTPCSIINDLDIMHTDLLCPDKFEERLGYL